MTAGIRFSELGLPEELVHALDRFGLETAFPIQSATIADALAGKDVLGKARTGSGKTLGFGLPMLTRLAQMEPPSPHKPYGIVLVPTRELAMQVGDALEPYAHSLGLSLRLIAGGLSMSKQIVALERGVHLLVATPGRLADLMRRGHADLSAVQISVLDEADHMAEMGFGEEIAEILSHTPDDGQRLLFSATLDGVVDDLVTKFMHSPVLHDVTSGNDVPSQRHVVLAIPPHEKYQTATRIAAREGRTICFVRTKLAADRVAAEMRELGVLAVALHGDRSQYERNLAMTEFRAGRLPVLVATDVAARGIHVDAVDLVLQIDPPADHRDYTHRSGRTGRAGADGLAVTMVLPHQRATFRRLLEKAGVDAEEATFRTIDDAARAQIDELTGGMEPSGEPVAEPMGQPRPDRYGRRGRFDERDGMRPSRGRDSRGGDRHMGERSFGDRRGPYRAPAGDDAFRERENQLAERERALAERERRIAEREASGGAVERDSRPQRDDRDARPARDTRPQRDDRPQRSDRAQWSDRPQRSDRGERPARFDRDSRPARDSRDSRPQWSDRGERPARQGNDGRPQWSDRPQRDDRGGASRPARDSRPQRDDRPQWSDRGERPARQGNDGRPQWSDRPQRDDRGGASRSFGSKPERGGYGKRNDSEGSSGGDRGGSWAPRSSAPRSGAGGSGAPRSGAPKSGGYSAGGKKSKGAGPQSRPGRKPRRGD